MKKIAQLTNVDKALLMHQLFPDEIPAFVDFIKSMCLTIKEHEQENRDKWDEGFIPFDFWLVQVNEAEAKISRYGTKLHNSPRLFSEQLFGGMLALFTNHCLRVYLTTKAHPDTKFTLAFDLLYNQ